ncbi:MAG: cobyric acid synthase [Thermoleophilia bacterium]
MTAETHTGSAAGSPRVLLIGGTGDSREVARALGAAGFAVLLSVATDYGEDLAADDAAVVRSGALDVAGMAELAAGCIAVVDASHPFARTVTETARAAAEQAGVAYLRFERPGASSTESAVLCESADDAARMAVAVAGAGGTVLLTVGSRTLSVYATACREAGVRCVARVLPVPDSLSACEAAGLPPADVIAMQGPTSTELDASLLRHLGAAVLVTKDSGAAGGVPEKLEAARLAGATAIVVARPDEATPDAVRSADEMVSRVRLLVARTPVSAPAHAAAAADVSSMAPVDPSATQAHVLMVQGTTSSAGKSVLVAGIARLFVRRGYDVAPFKSQNMALNSAVTPEGAEIGRAQAFQAHAARIEPHADMNPILLKPCSPTGSQVIVLGKPVGVMQVREYHAYQSQVWPLVTDALSRVRKGRDLVVIEGAGSPAEINIRRHDIANMAVALHVRAPVVIVADISRGGVFASLVGTMELLTPEERALVAGFVINCFRGDATLLDSGIAMLEQRYGVPVLGVLPFLNDWRGDEEDSLGMDTITERPGAPITVAAVRLPFISNFTDLAALAGESDVSVRWARTPTDLSGVDAIVIPGSKSTVSDLAWLRRNGLAEAIVAAAHEGVPVVGICGGYQILGSRIEDPIGVEGEAGAMVDGLALLDAVTVFEAEKRTVRARGELTGAALGPADTTVTGYEIHMGHSTLGADATPFARIAEEGGPLTHDGAVSRRLPVCGTYLHGIFDNDRLRRGWLDTLRAAKGLDPYKDPRVAADPVDRLADMLEAHLDLEAVARIVGLELGARESPR